MPSYYNKKYLNKIKWELFAAQKSQKTEIVLTEIPHFRKLEIILWLSTTRLKLTIMKKYVTSFSTSLFSIKNQQDNRIVIFPLRNNSF